METQHVRNAAKAAAATKVGQKAITAVVKGGAKMIGKDIAEDIPVVGIGVGAVCAASRAIKGDFLGAAEEVAAGVLPTVLPGPGDIASGAINAHLAAKDAKVI